MGVNNRELENGANRGSQYDDEQIKDGEMGGERSRHGREMHTGIW